MEEKIETLDLTNIILPPGVVSKVPQQLIAKYQFIPIALENNVLTVVFGKKPDEKTINEIKTAVKYDVKVILSAGQDISRHIQRLIPASAPPTKSLFARSISDSLQITRSQIVKYKNLVTDLISTRKKLNFVIIGGVTFVVVFCASLLVLFVWRGRSEEPPQKPRAVFLGKHALSKTIDNFTKQKNPTETGKVIYNRNNQSVVLIRTYQADGSPLAQGSGFVVRPDGAVITNFHVIREAHSIEIIMNPAQSDQAPIHFEVEGIIFADRENDLAVLKAVARDLPCVRLGDSDKLNPGDNVFVISSPLRDLLAAGEEIDTMNTLTQGIVSNTRKNKIQISAQISPGSSGGPVFNAQGEVIGVATMLIKSEFQAQNINFAMPINLVKNKISETNFIPVSQFDFQ